MTPVKSLLNGLQPLGRALMLPIAVLPIAGLLLRLGQPDLLNIGLLGAAGQAIFSNLGLLFAIGVATGFAADGNGAACLAGVVCFLVSRSGAEALMHVPAAAATSDLAANAWKQAAIAKIEVPIGILSGLLAGLFYNRFSTVKLPEYLGFFGGRRFVPILGGLAGVAIAALVGLSYAGIDGGIERLSQLIVTAGPAGLFAYGALNRLLLVTGLHHILNNVAWFVIGNYKGAVGDLPRFFAGDPTAGGFMTGFFPVMMFGLPAACLAMYRAAAPDRRKAVGGMLLSLALTSMLTGVTEPIEFSFMFLAPALYGVHALLTGVSMALTSALGMHLGFGFSAGLFDYVLNFGKATRPLLLLPIGAAYAALYYTVFSYAIRRFDLATPGRGAQGDTVAPADAATPRGEAFVLAMGGAANLTHIGACTTRLRLGVADQGAVDGGRLKALGAVGVLRPTPTTVQVVLGPIADQVAAEMRALASAPSPAKTADPSPPAKAQPRLSPGLSQALGGAANIVEARGFHGRVRVRLRDLAAADSAALKAAGIRHAQAMDDQTLYLLFAEARRPEIVQA